MRFLDKISADANSDLMTPRELQVVVDWLTSRIKMAAAIKVPFSITTTANHAETNES